MQTTHPPSVLERVFSVVAVITAASVGVWYVRKHQRKLKMAQMGEGIGRGAPSRAGVIEERDDESITAAFPVPIAVPNTATTFQQADDGNDEEHTIQIPPVENY